MMDVREIHNKALKNCPTAVMKLDAVYRDTDMPYDEYVAHLRILAYNPDKDGDEI